MQCRRRDGLRVLLPVRSGGAEEDSAAECQAGHRGRGACRPEDRARGPEAGLPDPALRPAPGREGRPRGQLFFSGLELGLPVLELLFGLFQFVELFDGIEDPHNLGAIMRSADVFEASGIILPKHNSVTLNATVAKTSAGAINYVPVAVVNNLNQAIKELKDEGFWIVSTDGSATISYSSIKYDFPVVVVIGSEGKGVSSLVLKNSDYIVKIPQFGHVNSLNASVAAGILLAEVHKSNS